MKYLISLVFLIATTFTAFSQDKEPVVLKNHSIALNLLSPGFQYELKLSEKNSFVVNGGLRTNVGWDDFHGFGAAARPFVQTGFRSYYSRKNVGKQLKSNSGNYLGGILGYHFGRIDEEVRTQDRSVVSGVVWGIQRNYKSNIHLGLNAGLGMSYSNRYGIRPTGMINFQLGFIIK